MEIARLRDDEAGAIAVLRGLEVLDSEPEAEFDAIVRAAALVCRTPISAISLIDVDRQWFKAISGLPGVTETPRDISFCAHVVRQDCFLEVPDATKDPRFADNPLVAGAPDIRFYAGAPVKLSNGTLVGSMCVIDRQPRHLDAQQREVLMCLADAAARALEGRHAMLAMQKVSAQAEQAGLVLEHSADAIIGVSADGQVLRWNPAAERLFGHAAGEIIGQSVRLLVPADSGDVVGEILNRVADGRAHAYETVRIHRDGRRIDVAVTAVPQFDAKGRLGGATGFVRDITASRRAERTALEQTEWLRLATDSAEIGVWALDPARGTVEWNDWMFRLYGVARAAGAQPMDLWSRHLHPDDAERVLADIGAALEGRSTYRPEFRIVWNSGEVRHLQAAAHVIRDDAGTPVRMIGVNLDVTRQRRSQEELQEAKKAAESANVAKSAFLANMSHEIRTPMNAILGMLALLRKTEMTVRQADYAGKTESAARSLLGLLDDILDFSKVEAGKMELDSEPFSIETTMSDLAVILSASTGTKNVEVLFDIDPSVPPLMVGDAMRLQQVLVNLGGNAVKFTAEGEVVISINVRSRDAGRASLEFAVRDTGIGIAPENQTRVFSGFTQAESSTTRRFGGTGLGLAISQRLVAMMGGELRLDSVPGRGTRFHFCIDLPVAAESTAWPVQSLAPRVLFVDDNPTAREVLERAAHSLGWTTEVAASGEQALEHFRIGARTGRRFDAVFTDWRMPGLDAWQTLRRIRDEHADAAAATPLLLMVTANGRETLLQRSEDEQALIAGFLVKPFTASMLAAALHEAQHGTGASPCETSGARRLQGLRLLVAEDNANNQQVARELLEDEGAVVQIASDGQAAIDALAAGHAFDVVLMDVQMPVMDGYTATARIRRELGLTALPIIAMTANAMTSDREACLAAGMNDHVSKPFDLDLLVERVRRHAGLPEYEACEPGALTSALPPLVADAAAVAGVDLRSALHRLGARADIYERALRSFLQDLAQVPARLRGQVEQADFQAAADVLHTLKGLAATLGAAGLADAAALAERRMAALIEARALHRQADDAIEPIVRIVEKARPALAALLHALQSQRQCEPAETGAVAEHALADYLSDLDALCVHLANGDMAATDSMDTLQQRVGGARRQGLQPIADAIDVLDFQRALHLGRHLLATAAK